MTDDAPRGPRSPGALRGIRAAAAWPATLKTGARRLRIAPQPHEMLMALASLVIGIVGTVFPEQISVPVAMLFPSPWARVFYAFIGLFGAVVLISVPFRTIEGRLVERLGLYALAAFFAAYAGMVISTRGTGGIVASIIPLAWAIGNVWRGRQITSDLKTLTRYMRDHPDEEIVDSREVRIW